MFARFKKYIKEVLLPYRRNELLEKNHLQSKITYGISRGGATAPLRQIDYMQPSTWEFSGFSQNGEDGIIDVLLSQLKHSNRYFIEVGASDGFENNTSWLAFARNFKGLMIEGDPFVFETLDKVTPWFVEGLRCFVNEENISIIEERTLHKDPDVLSLDIDGMDYYIIKTLFEYEYRPKILVVEYNSAFGPEKEVTVPYDPTFNVTQAHPTKLYYGVSVKAWQKLLCPFGYRFVGVENNGVNAFFIKEEAFEGSFVSGIKGAPFRENAHQLRKFKMTWEGQFEKISDMPFANI